MQQNCQITRCIRQHTKDSVLKSAKPHRDLTGSRNVVAQAWSVSPKSHELLGDKFANCISNNSMVVSTCELYLQQEIYCASRQFPFFGWVEASVTWHAGNGGHCLLTVGGWFCGAKIGAECVKYIWLSCPARLSGWVLCISMQWLRLKACHVACDEYASGEICSLQHMWVTGSVMWAVASGASLKFGVQGASATNWFSRDNSARDNGIRL